MISKKLFLNGSFKKRVDKFKENPVTIFLQENNKYAFTVVEIKAKVNKSGSQISSILRKLKKQRKILVNSPYYMWK